MFDHVHHHPVAHVPCLCASCAPLRLFADENRDGLLNAGTLLGGRRGEALVLSVLDGLSGTETSTRRLRRDLGALHDLLTLEHVHDEARPEAALFAAVDPWDPVVEEICLLADGLHDAIEEWDALHAQTDEEIVDERAAA